MYAIISDRGRQHFVSQGQKVAIDLCDAEPGQTLEFDRVLLLGGLESGPLVGRPTVEGAKVLAQVLRGYRTKKIHVQTYKRRKNYRRHRGHRQWMTEIQVQRILLPGQPSAQEEPATQTEVPESFVPSESSSPAAASAASA